MNNALKTAELFREFAVTDSPFEKWHLFRQFTDDATFIYLPNQKQSYLCNLQFGIYQLMRSKDPKDVADSRNLTRWLLSHQQYVKALYSSASPVYFYNLLIKMTPEQIATAKKMNSHLFLCFNPKYLSFPGRSKPTLMEKLFSRSKYAR